MVVWVGGGREGGREGGGRGREGGREGGREAGGAVVAASLLNLLTDVLSFFFVPVSLIANYPPCF